MPISRKSCCSETAWGPPHKLRDQVIFLRVPQARGVTDLRPQPGKLLVCMLLYNRQLALKALNERMRSIPVSTSWPTLEDESETVASERISAAVSGYVESASSTLPMATDINIDTADTSVAMSTASSATSETQEEQH